MERTERIGRLIDEMIHQEPEICVERAIYYDEGFRQSKAKSQIEKRADAIAHVLKNMTIYIGKDELIVGNQGSKPRSAPIYPEFAAKWILNELDLLPLRESSKFNLSDENKQILKEILIRWDGKTVNDYIMAELPEEVKTAQKAVTIIHSCLSCGTGHFVLRYEDILKTGILAYKKMVKERMRLASTENELAFCRAGLTMLESIRVYTSRYQKLARTMAENEVNEQRQKELMDISSRLLHVPDKPPRDLAEAIQMFFIIHTILQIETNGHSISPGRFDQYMYPYYLKSRERGASDEEIQELVDSLWVKFNQFNKIRDTQGSKCFDGYPMFQNVILGGINRDGECSVNHFTYICLRATEHTRLPQPSLSVRISKLEDDQFYHAASRVASIGLGMPAFFNDHVIIPSLVRIGYSLEDARDYAEVGCVEPQVPGTAFGFHTAGYICLAKCLELAMHNGRDPISGLDCGVPTGDAEELRTYDQLLAAYKKQFCYAADLVVRGANIAEEQHATYAPSPLASLFIDGCLAQCKTMESGGAEYNFSAVNGVGMANTADSLAALKKIVYDDKIMTLKQMVDKLDQPEIDETFMDFLLKQPKYGNDDDYVDSIADEISNYYYDTFRNKRNWRGGTYTVGFQSISTHIAFSEVLGNTPDGKKFGESLADGGLSAAQGRDRLGPTALIKSVSRINQFECSNGVLFNIKLNPSVVEGERNLDIFTSIIKSCRDLDVGEVQFNIVSKETLLDAQANPKKYQHLVVRVAGFSVFFTTICKELQDDIISRTEHK